MATSKFLKGISVGKFNSAPGHRGQYSFGGKAVLTCRVAEYVTHSCREGFHRMCGLGDGVISSSLEAFSLCSS